MKLREQAESYVVTIRLGVEDAQALWEAAAERAMASPGMTLGDVLDTIGPREDPAIADCIAMLAAPPAMPGCAPQDFDIARIATGGIPAAAANGNMPIRLPLPPRRLVARDHGMASGLS